jgi:hypothetical protein
MIKTQFRSKFYKNVNDAMTDYGNYQMQLNLDNFNQLQKIDKSNIGTHKYFGLAYFWDYDYRHYLRDATIKQKIFIHKQFIKNKVPLLKDKGSKYFHYCAEGVRIIKSYKPLMKRLGVIFGTINNQPKELN